MNHFLLMGIENRFVIWLFLKDTVHTIYHIIKKGNIGEIYNIGENNKWENIEVLRFILQTLGKSEMLIRDC